MSYPDYAPAERLADVLVHLSGLVMATAGIAVFLLLNAADLHWGEIAGLTVYWLGLLAMISTSMFYHATPWEALRPTLRKLDHAMIYLKIAGTYTPLVIALGSWLSYAFLALIWGLALVGAVAKLFFWRTPGRWGAGLYLALGWGSLFLIWMLFDHSVAAGWCAVAGGLTYTAGVVFFHWESLKFANAIWHGFVITASGLFFASVWLSVLA